MRIGPYEVASELGRGGAGVVFRARGADGRDVAIKVLRRQDSPDALARFEREKRLLGALGEQEGFVPLLDAGAERGAPYVVMPFLAGGTLRARLGRGPMKLEDAVALVRALAQTLGRAHERGIVHRDVKPENIIFAADGRALVADLGLAKHFDRNTPGASQSVSLSGEGQLRGTAGYMAPEQLRDAASVRAPADVFALGAILFECLAGEPAFTGQTLLELITNVERCDPAPLKRFRADVPTWLDAVVRRALARDPVERYQDGLALAHALRDGPALDGRRRRGAGLRVALLVAAVGLVGALGASLARSTTRGGPPAPPSPVRLGKDGGPAPEIPAACAGFAKSAHLRLASVLGSYAWKHSDRITAVAFSPAGDAVASGSEDRTARIWDAATGAELATFDNEQPVRALAWAADGGRLVTSSDDGSVRVWDVARGSLRSKIATAPNGAGVLALDRSGDLLCAGPAPLVHVLDLEKGAVRRSSPCPEGLGVMALSMDGRRAASVARTGAVTVWDIATRRVLRSVDTKKPFTNVALSAAGEKLLVSTSEDLTAYDVDGEGATPSSEPQAMSPAIAFAPDGESALFGDMGFTVSLHGLGTRKGRVELEKGILPVHAVALSKTRAAWGRANQLVVRDLASGRTSATMPLAHGLALSGDGKRVATACLDGKAYLWDLETGRLARTLDHKKFFSLVAFTADRELLTLGTDGAMALWDTATGEVVRRTEPAKKILAAAGIARDASVLALAWSDGEIEIRDLRAGTVQNAPLPNTKFVDIGVVNGKVEACADNGEVHVIDLAKGQGTRSRPRPRALHAAFAEDGSGALVGDRLVVFANLEGTIDVLGEHPGDVTALAVSLDRKRALSASQDGTVILWDMRGVTKKELDRISLASAHDFATSVAFTRSGFLLATARGVVLHYDTGF